MSIANDSTETLSQLLERAAGEKDRTRFLELLHEIGLRIQRRNEKGRSLKTVVGQPAMETDTFDIFAGPPDRHAIWKESISGIDRARQRLEEVAATAPGEYFIFHERTRAVLGRVASPKPPMPSAQTREFPPFVIRAAS